MILFCLFRFPDYVQQKPDKQHLFRISCIFSNSKNNLCGTDNNAFMISPTFSLTEYNVSIQLVVLCFLCFKYVLAVPVKSLSLNHYSGNDERNVHLESPHELLLSLSNAMAVVHYPSGSPPDIRLP